MNRHTENTPDIESLSLNERRALEVQRYDQLHRGNRLYGASNHGAAARDLLLRLGVESLLDVGCGDNSFAKWWRSEGVLATGVDFADSRADFLAPAHNLPFPDDHFAWVAAFDVLEHLWPDEIDAVLCEFRRVGRVGLVVSISYEPAKTPAPGGNLHRTVKPESWWLDKLARILTKVQIHKGYLYGRFKP